MNFISFISLGSSCSIAENLRKSNLRNFALPFDWIRVNNFKNINLMLKDDFKELFDIKNFNYLKTSSNFFILTEDLNFVKDDVKVYQNIKYNVNFYHDFNDELSNCFETFEKKYKRRIDRLLKIIKESTDKKIIFIREQINPKLIKISDLEEFISIIKNLNSKLKFKILVVINNYKNLDLSELERYSEKSKYIILITEKSKIESWERYNIFQPILDQYLNQKDY
jgi:hypothetical protein